MHAHPHSHESHTPAVAITVSSHLVGLGLKSILEKIIPVAEIEVFGSFEELVESDNTRFSHFFTSFSIFSANREFFEKEGSRSIVLIDNSLQASHQGFLSLNINQSEELIVRDIIKLRSGSRVASHAIHPCAANSAQSAVLSAREKQVLVLVAQGYINKQIADKMNISVTTVISHRKNITAKLGIRSVAGLAIYAISNGYIDTDSIK